MPLVYAVAVWMLCGLLVTRLFAINPREDVHDSVGFHQPVYCLVERASGNGISVGKEAMATEQSRNLQWRAFGMERRNGFPNSFARVVSEESSNPVVTQMTYYEPFNQRLEYLERQLLKARKYLEERGLNKRVERQ